MAHIIKEKDGKQFIKKLKLETEPEKLRALLDKSRWTILKILAEKPTYPADLAKKLKMHEQKIYYHIKQLETAGLIHVVNKMEKGGALAKYYGVKDHAFALELPFGDEKLTDFAIKKESSKLKSFLYPFINNGRIDANIVVGSPDPHGPHQVRARDGHYASDMAIFLGQFCTLPKEFVTKLDINVKSEGKYDKHLILIGGVLTNVITSEMNNYLPIKYQAEKFPFRNIFSEKTGKVYSEDDIGIIVKAVNPLNKEKSILVIAGNRYAGTKAAILAITRFTDKILENYNGEDNWGIVVQGFDMDGDGEVDSIKVLE